VRHGANDPERTLRLLKLFQERRCNFSAVNHNGEAPLHGACLRGNLAAVKFLLAQAANPNCKTT
jgi:ankyrin repeat protein